MDELPSLALKNCTAVMSCQIKLKCTIRGMLAASGHHLFSKEGQPRGQMRYKKSTDPAKVESGPHYSKTGLGPRQWRDAGNVHPYQIV